MTAERPLRADARRNRARLLEVAETVFTTQGVDAPVEEVARMAGVGVGTVYRHFPTKQDLVEAIVAGRLSRLAEYTNSFSDRTDSSIALVDVIDRIVAEATVKKHFGADAPDSEVKRAPAVEAASADLHAALAQLWSAAQACGAVRADLELSDLMVVLYGLSASAEHYGWDESGRRHAIGTVFDGLSPRG